MQNLALIFDLSNLRRSGFKNLRRSGFEMKQRI